MDNTYTQVTVLHALPNQPGRQISVCALVAVVDSGILQPIDVIAQVENNGTQQLTYVKHPQTPTKTPTKTMSAVG